jgi:hypothetical protein
VGNGEETDFVLGAAPRIVDSRECASFALRKNVISFLHASRLHSKDGGSKFLRSVYNNLQETAVHNAV